jgi:hypothetical protein
MKKVLEIKAKKLKEVYPGFPPTHNEVRGVIPSAL